MTASIVLLIILLLQMNENAFYTCRAVWSIIKVYAKEKQRWRVYILKEMGPKFMLWVETSVIYRVS